MKKFMDNNFLLTTNTAQKLYHDYAKSMPIIDYHCHIDPKEIAQNITFENITQLWLYGDHYKWRQMRSNGIDERYITGDASDREKFQKWAETLERAIGNPLYHWSHLELKEYFGYEGFLNSETAEEVWNLTSEKLKNGNISARSIIEQSKVEVICTTDDPIDSLEHHINITETAEETNFKCKVLPTFRPDKAMNIELPTFLDYIKDLSNISGVDIKTFKDLSKAISLRIEFFNSVGCNISDHGLEYLMYKPATTQQIEDIFQKRLKNSSTNEITKLESLQYKTAFIQMLAKEYTKHNWVMQLHFGCKRNNNTKLFNKLGADTGFDCINNYSSSAEIADILNSLELENSLPKTILYSLNPNDDAMIGTIIGCFQDSSCRGKIQHGSGWWFNDNKIGMINQMTSLANLGLLSNFLGMLTDSRSFLSYTRHEYFRRILCELIGTWVENGEYPEDFKTLENIIKDISYNNAKNYFEFS